METLIDEAQQTPLDTVTVSLPRFGDCTYTESEVIRFPWGLPGFATLHRFLVLSVDAEERYIWLQSLDDVKIAIPLCDPWSIFDDYEAPLPLYAKQSLDLESADSFCVMCVLVGRPGAETTINLLAPVIINIKSRIGRQITLENHRYSVRTPMPHGDGSKEVVLK
jgi:flagellar assembly factor FliW